MIRENERQGTSYYDINLRRGLGGASKAVHPGQDGGGPIRSRGHVPLYLSQDERMKGMKVLAKSARGRAPTLVLGVQGKNTEEMLEYARAAESLEPDALIAIPPREAKSLDDYREYFADLARLSRRPVFIQTGGGAPDIKVEASSSWRWSTGSPIWATSRTNTKSDSSTSNERGYSPKQQIPALHDEAEGYLQDNSLPGLEKRALLCAGR